MMSRGEHEEKALHHKCAAAWYAANPRNAAPKGQALQYLAPPQDLQEFIKDFVAGAIPRAHLDATAGSGKSNTIVFTVDELRAIEASFIVLVFGTNAKRELRERGLSVQEVRNFHSFLFRAYCLWVESALNQQAQMLDATARQAPSNSISPTVVHAKQHLVVSFLFRKDTELGPVYAMWLRPFVVKLCNQARVHGFGRDGAPAMHDYDAMGSLVQKYKLAPKLEACWSSVVAQPQKLAIERTVGAGEEARLKFAIQVASRALETGFLMATNVIVDGMRNVVNEVTGSYHPFPIVDYADMEHVCAIKGLVGGTYDYVLVDEGQDLNANEKCAVESALRPQGKLLVVSDVSQMLSLWSGTEEPMLREWFSTFRVYQDARNYRSSRLICNEAQVYLDQLGRNLTINPQRDVDGVVVCASFFGEPINTSVTTLVLARSVAECLAFYYVLLIKGYAVNITGRPETASELVVLLGDLGGTLAQVRTRLASRSSVSALSEEDRDHRAALELLIDTFELETQKAKSPYHNLEFHMPNARSQFEKFVREFYKPCKEGTRKGTILVGTPHAVKGLASDDGYIVNPRNLPLKQRLELGGWEEYEELCIAFVARTRVRNRLIYLPELDSTTRAEVLTLFAPPGNVVTSNTHSACPSGPSTQETEPLASSDDDDDESDDDSDGASETKHAQALGVLGLSEIPATTSALDAVVKPLLLGSHPDRNSGSTAQERTVAVLQARTLLKAAIVAAAGSNAASKSAPKKATIPARK